MFKLPHHEFWNGRLYETPGYFYIAFNALIRGFGLKTLLKANYGLDHGGATFASKYKIQQYLGEQHFPVTAFLAAENKKNFKTIALNFTQTHGYPVILKPDYGFTGRGVFKVEDETQLKTVLPYLKIDYLIQKFVPSSVECGIFYIRVNKRAFVSGINQKHFPTLIGDGVSTIKELAEAHERHNHFWGSYLAQQDLAEVLPKGTSKRISDIGSHTLGCKFTHDPDILTPALEQAVLAIFKNRPGFNYGRVDVLADNLKALKKGDFTMVEANGVESLPTNVFDPKLTVWQSYKILFKHLKYLAQIAAEHRRKPLQYSNLWHFAVKSLRYKKAVEDQQTALESLPNFK